MKRMHSSGNDDSCISFSSLRRDPFVKHSRRLEGKKKENWRILLAFRRFQLRSRRGKEPLSLLIYLYLSIASFRRIALSCIMAGRTSIVVYLLARRNTLETCNQPKIDTKLSRVQFSQKIRSEDTRDTKELYLAHVILVIPRERERYILENDNIPSLDISLYVRFV